MDRAQARAGQHGDDGLGHHRQVDHHAVAARHAQRGQRAGGLRDAPGQLGVGEAHDLAGHRAVPDQRRLRAAAGGDVAIQAVVAGVQHGAGEPAAKGAGRGVEQRVPALVPGDALGGFRPPGLAVAGPCAVGRRVAGAAERRIPGRSPCRTAFGVLHGRPPGPWRCAPGARDYHLGRARQDLPRSWRWLSVSPGCLRRRHGGLPGPAVGQPAAISGDRLIQWQGLTPYGFAAPDVIDSPRGYQVTTHGGRTGR